VIELAMPESVGLCSQRLTRVSEWLQQQISSERLAGASVLIGRRGKVAYFDCAGLADQAAGKPFAQDTIVRIYSMTKPITTVAAMMLYEQGCFQLDDPIALYLPEFKDMRVWLGGDAGLDETVAASGPITVKQLMTHTSGLTYGFMQANPVDRFYRDEGIEPGTSNLSLQEMVERLAAAPLLCQPGSAWNYSLSSDVLGRLVEVWSGLSLDEFFRTRIFEPLDMRDAAFHVSTENQHRFAACYSPLSGASLANVAGAVSDVSVPKSTGLKLQDAPDTSAYLQPPELFSGGGGLTASMRDYARFCQMLLGNGELDGQRLLGRKTVEFMRQNHLPDNRDMAAMGQPVWSETSYEGIGFGLGFAVVVDPVKAQIMTSTGEHHWGGAASTFFWLDAVEDLYVVMLTQLMPSSTYPIRRELRTRVYQALVD
jgi:CubicO group peptidase (beta-lactamase class C family)